MLESVWCAICICCVVPMCVCHKANTWILNIDHGMTNVS